MIIYSGIEFGSTRIKAVLVDEDHVPIAQGSYEWENQLVDGVWTYSMELIWFGLYSLSNQPQNPLFSVSCYQHSSICS